MGTWAHFVSKLLAIVTQVHCGVVTGCCNFNRRNTRVCHPTNAKSNETTDFCGVLFHIPEVQFCCSILRQILQTLGS